MHAMNYFVLLAIFVSGMQDAEVTKSLAYNLLYEQTTSNPAFTEIQQPIAYLLDFRLEQKPLVTYHTLQSL